MRSPLAVRVVLAAILVAAVPVAAAAGPEPDDEGRVIAPVTLHEVVYRVVRRERKLNGNLLVEVAVAAEKQRTGRPICEITAYLGSPGGLADSDGPPSVIDPPVLLEPFALGLLLTTARNQTLYLDPQQRTIVEVFNAQGSRRECEVHHLALEGGIAPMRYGYPRSSPAASKLDTSAYPYPFYQPGVGCAPMQRSGAIRYCPRCDELARAARKAAGTDAKGPNNDPPASDAGAVR